MKFWFLNFFKFYIEQLLVSKYTYNVACVEVTDGTNCGLI
jgi:hypothetical protein